MEVIVLGMHRSGTSLACGILNMMGVYFGETAMLMRDQFNQKGYFERFLVKEVQDYILHLSGHAWNKLSDFSPERLDQQAQQVFDNGMKPVFDECRNKPVWGIKDPRTCLLFPLWKKHLTRPVCIFAFRSPYEVALSLSRRDGFPIEYGMTLWEIYNVIGLQCLEDIPTLYLDFDRMTEQPEETINHIYTWLKDYGVTGINRLTGAQINSFFDQSLLHHRDNAKEQEKYITRSQKELYKNLKMDPTGIKPGELIIPSETIAILANNEEIISHGVQRTVLADKLVNQIGGTRNPVVIAGSGSGELSRAVGKRLPEARIIEVKPDDNEVRISDRGREIAAAREYGAAFRETGKIIGNNPLELLILDCILFKPDSPLDLLLNIRPLLAPRAQILIVERNPRNLLALKRLIDHAIWQGAESPFDIRDKKLLTTRELVRLLTMSGYRVRSGQYNIDSRLQRIYEEEVTKNTAEVTIGKITLRHSSKDELTELCSNYVLLDVSLAQ